MNVKISSSRLHTPVVCSDMYKKLQPVREATRQAIRNRLETLNKISTLAKNVAQNDIELGISILGTNFMPLVQDLVQTIKNDNNFVKKQVAHDRFIDIWKETVAKENELRETYINLVKDIK
jgi:hypothetical protein